MPLVTTKDILLKAQSGKYAVGAFNIENMEMAQAVVRAAEELNAPVIIQTTSSTLQYAEPAIYRANVAALAQTCSVPIAIHLDHGSSYELAVKCLDASYTSVMIDGSKLPFEENIKLTKKVVEVCHQRNVPVEAELGQVGGKEDDVVADNDTPYTNPDEAVEFVKRTLCDSLAVGIGTAHGVYKGEPDVRIDVLASIHKVVDIPLVMHGTSGVPDDVVVDAIKNGICKVNYATDLRIAYTRALREFLTQDTKAFDPKLYGALGREFVCTYVKNKIRVCGSENKA